MPELPEVETTARALRPRLVGRTVSSVGAVDWPRMLPNASAAEMSETLVGRSIEGVDRRGKYVLIGFASDVWLSLHRKMSANILLHAAATPRPVHTHLEIGVDDGTLVRFVDPRKFGRIHLFHSGLARDEFLAQRLGPDSLLDLDASLLVARLRGRRGRLKSLLLNQAFLAGVGNLYADEALWLSRIHPLRTADELSAAEAKRLSAAIKQVLQDAIDRRGTSFDATYRDVDGEPGENQAFLNAYGREGQACPRCGRPIQRIIVGGRSTHFCGRCQHARTSRLHGA